MARPAQATSVDIARFALLSVVSLPFAMWSVTFTYDYVYRVKITAQAIRRQDEDLLGDKDEDSGDFLGREKELAEVIVYYSRYYLDAQQFCTNNLVCKL